MKQKNYVVESVRWQIINKLIITNEQRKIGYSGIVIENACVTDEIVDRFVLCLTKWDPWAEKITEEEAEKIDKNEYADDDVYYIGKEIWATSEDLMDIAHATDDEFDVNTGNFREGV